MTNPQEYYYEITQNDDKIEGRGGTSTTGIYFWKYDDALAFVESDRYRKFGIMGMPGTKYDIQKKTVKLPKIYNTLAEYDHANPDKELLKKMREAALNKLTEQDKKVLGLS